MRKSKSPKIKNVVGGRIGSQFRRLPT